MHTMQTERTTFYSDGLRLSGTFFMPDEADRDAVGSVDDAGAGGQSAAEPAPLVIACSGFTGLMTIHPARFARSLTAAGHWCFGFDYRGFAESEGERGRVVLEEQVRDILHAIAFAGSDPRVDEKRIVLLGWGMGAGLVLDAARQTTGIVGVIGANGFYDGARVQRAHRGPDGLDAFRQAVARDRGQRARTGQSQRVDPFDLYPLDEDSRAYVDRTLRRFEHYDAEAYTYELGESLLRWRPEAHAPEMDLPLLIAHGDRNALHPTAEATALFDRYAGPKELFWIEDAGHTEFMHDDDPRYRSLAAKVVEFVDLAVR